MTIKNVRWDITGVCNLSCNHCQAAKYYQNNANDLDIDKIKIVVDKLVEADVETIGLLGGEPLVRKDIIEIAKYIKSKKIRLVMNTNGILINENNIHHLIENCDNIVVSLDGVCKVSHEKLRGIGTFDKTVKNIKLLCANRKDKKIGVSYVLNQHNYKDADKIYEFMKSLNVDYCLVDVVHETGNAKENWDKISLNEEAIIESLEKLITNWNFESDVVLVPRMYTNLFRDKIYSKTGVWLNDKYVCDAPGITSLYMLNDGTVLPNQFFAYIEGEKIFPKKSLVEYSFEEIFSQPEYQDFINLYDDQLFLNYYIPCKTCKYSGKQCNPSPVSYYFGRKTPVDICNFKV